MARIIGRQVVRQTADLEQALHRGGGVPQHQPAAGIERPLVCVDHDAQAAGVHELDLLDVEHDVAVARRQLGESLGEVRRGVCIELAGEGETIGGAPRCRDVLQCRTWFGRVAP